MPDTTITGLPNATTPLTGTERVPMDQDGATKDASTQAIADLAGPAISAAVAAHAGAADPHPGYLTAAEGNAAYDAIGAASAAQAAAEATAAGALGAHVAAGDPHPAYLLESAAATVATTGAYADLSGKPTLGTAAAAATTDFAPAAQGVTNGNSHSHDGGDGAQIAYSSLSGLPTLGDAAAKNTGTTAGTVAAGDDSRIVLAVQSNVTGITGADAITNIVSLTQAEYDAVVSPSATTLYVITD